jgi:hypothetical protein
MFRNLARLIPAPANLGAAGPAIQVFRVHPFQLSRWLEEAWIAARTVPEFGTRTVGALPFLGSDQIVDVLDLPAPSASSVAPPFPSGINPADVGTFNGEVFSGTVPLIWDHLAYAYLLECTGVIEVMAEVVRRFAVGETLNTLSADGTRWVRATEELFYREPPLFAISGITSEARPDLRVTRRNNYWRMFGMEPPHPVPTRWRKFGYAEQGWRADTGEGVNSGFREKWTELLRQVWLGFENARNGIGPNATDREYVAFLCQSLRDMMTMRRRGGQLAREEFVHVTTLSWFHLTLETDTPIVVDLKAEATNPADRLAKIAERVGLSAAPRSYELFELADLMSGLLRAIELGLFDRGEDAETLFLPITGNEGLVRDMNRIIDLWQSATGDRVKDRPAQPARVPGLPVARRATTAPAAGGVVAPASAPTTPPPAPAAMVPAGSGLVSATASHNGTS